MLRVAVGGWAARADPVLLRCWPRPGIRPGVERKLDNAKLAVGPFAFAMVDEFDLPSHIDRKVRNMANESLLPNREVDISSRHQERIHRQCGAKSGFPRDTGRQPGNKLVTVWCRASTPGKESPGSYTPYDADYSLVPHREIKTPG